MARSRRSGTWLAAVFISAVIVAFPVRSHAQEEERPEVLKALQLESDGKYREAATAFRASLRATPTPGALLGLERVYAELRITDSLVTLLDTLIQGSPKEPVYRTVQLRTLQMLHRDQQLQPAFEAWARAAPREAAPYREYARILIALGRPASADSIVSRGRRALGSLRDLEFENAQSRAAMGDWVSSAESWRRALTDAPYYASAAGFALTPTPTATRDSVRAALLTPPADVGSRNALAQLEMNWGNPAAAWDALRAIKADTAAASVWEDFGDRAFAEERWSIARDAFTAALGARKTTSLASRAAAAALRAGSPNDVFVLAPLTDVSIENLVVARQYIPAHVGALVALNRVDEAEAMITKYERAFLPAQRMRLAQVAASAWVRTGNIERARQALRAAGPDADSSEAAGWLALYDGRLTAARALLRLSATPTPDLSLALGIMARTKLDRAPVLGSAFLALARGDSADASAKFFASAAENQDAAPALLSQAARVHGPKGGGPVAIWRTLIEGYPDAPEAVEAELDWARSLRRAGDNTNAIAHLEHLILSAPQSALLPQARRELEQLRGSVPP